MAVDILSIKKGLAATASTLVGSKLYQHPSTGNTKVPAVYLERQSEPHSNYPYILIQHFSVRAPNGWGLTTYVDENDRKVVEDVESILFSYKIFGREKGNDLGKSLNILQELRSYLVRYSSCRRLLNSNCNATLETIQSIEDNSYTDKQSYIAAYSFYFTMLATNKDADPIGDGLIEHVVSDEIILLRDDEDDNPLSIDFEIPPLND